MIYKNGISFGRIDKLLLDICVYRGLHMVLISQ